MSLAAQYAKALFSVKKPELRRVREALARRGHEKLMPHIYAEYEKLALREKRLTEQKKITPERSRTRLLLELYKKLTNV